MKDIIVPGDKLRLMFNLLKKLVSTSVCCKRIMVTPKGLYASYGGDIRLFVPVPLDMDVDCFELMHHTIPETLLRNVDANSTVTFSTNGIDEEERERELRKSLQNGKNLVLVTYTECGVTKRVILHAYFEPLLDYTFDPFCLEMVEFSKFLSAVASCVPYGKNADTRKYLLTSICIDDTNLVAANGHRMICVRNVDVPPLLQENKKSPTRFLLNGDISTILPKSGICRLAFSSVSISKSLVIYNDADYDDDEVSVIDKVVNETKVYPCLCIGFSDYYISVCGNPKAKYPQWRDIVPEICGDEDKVSIALQDAEVVSKQLNALPKSDKYDNFIRLYKENDRLRQLRDDCAVSS
jgi:hypothetical protein